MLRGEEWRNYYASSLVNYTHTVILCKSSHVSKNQTPVPTAGREDAKSGERKGKGGRRERVSDGEQEKETDPERSISEST